MKGKNGRKMKFEVCFAFQKGECTRGDKCRFAHEGAEGGAGKQIVKATVRGGRRTLPT